MDMTIGELDALTEKISSMRVQIAEMERKLSEKEIELTEKDEMINQLTVENSIIKEEKKNAQIENAYLRNIIILSGERIKEFMKRVVGIERWAFLRTFLEWALPEKSRKEQMKLLDEIMELPEEQKPKVVHVSGNYNDVHDNTMVNGI